MLAEELLAIIENPTDCLTALFDLALKFSGDRILESLTTLAVDGVTKLLQVSANSRGSYFAHPCISLQDGDTIPIFVDIVVVAIKMAPQWASNFSMLSDSLKELAGMRCACDAEQSITKV